MLLYSESCGLCGVRQDLFVEKLTDMHHALWPPLLTPVLIFSHNVLEVDGWKHRDLAWNLLTMTASSGGGSFLSVIPQIFFLWWLQLEDPLPTFPLSLVVSSATFPLYLCCNIFWGEAHAEPSRGTSWVYNDFLKSILRWLGCLSADPGRAVLTQLSQLCPVLW